MDLPGACGKLDGLGRLCQRFVLIVQRHVTPGAAYNVQGQVASHAEHPTPCGASQGIETARAMPDLDKGVMHNVLGQGLVAGNAQCHTEQTAAVLLIELVQGALIAAGAG